MHIWPNLLAVFYPMPLRGRIASERLEGDEIAVVVVVVVTAMGTVGEESRSSEK